MTPQQSAALPKGMLLSILSACCYGVLPILGKLGYAAGLDLGGLLFCRFTFAALFVGSYLLLTDRRRLRLSRRSLAHAFVLGALIYPVQSLCFFGAVQIIPASTTTLVFYGYPLSVTLLFWALGGPRPGRNVWYSLALIGAGICLVFYNAFLQRAEPLGLLLAAGALAVFSVYLYLLQRFLKDQDPLSVTFWVLVFAACSFTLGGLPGSALFTAPAKAWLIGALLGLVPTALSVTMLYQAVKLIGSAYVSLFSTLEPGVTVLGSWLVLAEPLLPLKLMGLALIIVGIVLPNLKLLRESRRPKPGAPPPPSRV